MTKPCAWDGVFYSGCIQLVDGVSFIICRSNLGVKDRCLPQYLDINNYSVSQPCEVPDRYLDI